VYHVKGWGKFNRNYGDFCTGADNPKGALPFALFAKGGSALLLALLPVPILYLLLPWPPPDRVENRIETSDPPPRT